MPHLSKNTTSASTATSTITCKLLALACALLMSVLATPVRAQTFQDVYDFDCGSGNGGPGCQPINLGQLAQGFDGNLYGTTDDEGNFILGTIFVVSPNGSMQNDLWSFDGTTGEFPHAGLTLASDGNFYGTTFNGGDFGNGVVYRFTPPSTITVLHSFASAASDGVAPRVPPVQAADGNLYGMTGTRTTYRITLPAGTFTLLPHLTPGNVAAPFVLGSDGNLYGTTSTGGAHNKGTVFRMTTKGMIKIIHSFNGTDGSAPGGPLAQGSGGNLLGTTSLGGTSNAGTIFKVSLTGTFTSLHSFNALGGGGINNGGAGPTAGLVFADGVLYGATPVGGANANGTVFQITPAGTFTNLHDFVEGIDTFGGSEAETTPMEHTNGSIYGMTARSGINTWGNVYSLSPATVIPILKVAGPVLVKPGDPVQILGNNLTHVSNLTFGGVAAQFTVASDTHMVATVPSAAIHGPVAAQLNTGATVQTALPVEILPVVTSLDKLSGPVGTLVTITGGGFVGATKVTFGGVAASFTVNSATKIVATVPVGAKSGKVVVTNPSGTAASPKKFTVT